MDKRHLTKQHPARFIAGARAPTVMMSRNKEHQSKIMGSFQIKSETLTYPQKSGPEQNRIPAAK